jgi:YD repeat-containing protein
MKSLKDFGLKIAEEKFDDRGNLIYRKKNKSECWQEFDDKNRIVYYKFVYSKNNRVLERWYEYEGNLIKYKDSEGSESTSTVDERGNIIHQVGKKRFEFWKEYDEENRNTYYKDNRGTEWRQEFDKRGNITHYKDGYKELWQEFDENDKLIYTKQITVDGQDNYEWWGIKEGNLRLEDGVYYLNGEELEKEN